MIGCYIREYEQNGEDRAKYGAQILEYLGKELQSSLDKCYTARYLRLCRQFYATYPHIRKSLISKFEPQRNQERLGSPEEVRGDSGGSCLLGGRKDLV